MVQMSNQTTIINPSVLAANREANVLCPKVIFNDIELTLTLKLLETKLYNLCLEQNSFKLLVSDLLIAQLMGRKERTARNYITKLIKLGKIKKLACKEKGKYYLVLNYNDWMQLNKDEIISIDENFNLIPNSFSQEYTTLHSNADFLTVSAIDDAANANSASLSSQSEEVAVSVAIENQRVEVETISLVSTKLLEAQQELSETEEAESFYNQLNENQEDELLSLCFVVEEIWQKNGKLDEVKKTWINNSSTDDCLENFVTEQILLQIKLDYAAALKESIADNCDNCNSLDNDEVKNAAIFTLTTRYKKSKQLEQIEAIEQVEAKPATEYLLEAVGQSHPISVNQIATSATTLANSCQNTQAQKIDLFNNKINLAKSCQNGEAQASQTTTELTKEEVGKSLPNNSNNLEISEISEPVKQEQPKRVFYPGSLKAKQPLLKNYFWNIS